MAFFNSAVTVLQTLVIALGAGLGIWGAINLLEGYGNDNPGANVEGMKFYEVQKYFTEVNYQFHPDPFYVNAEWWNSLPAEFQAILTECATAMGEYNDQLIDQNSDAAKQVVVDAGCEVYVPTAEELAAFQAACQPVYTQVVEEGICTQAELDEMLAIVAAVRGE